MSRSQLCDCRTAIRLLQCLGALTFALALGACSTAARPVADTPQPVFPAYGSYLAGQQAQLRGDTAAAADFYLRALAADPDNMVLMQQTFSLAVSDGRYKDAQRIARRLVAADSFNSLPEIFLVLTEIRQKEYEHALASLDTIVDAGLNRLLKPLIEAWALVGAGRPEEGLEALAVLDTVPAFRVFGLDHRAYILDYLGRADAEDAYKTIMGSSRQGSLRSYLAHAGLLARQGRMDEARAVIALGRDRHPDSPSLDVAQERLLAAAGGDENIWHPIINGPAEGVAEAFYGAASALSQDQANAPAAFYLRLALYANPDFAEARFLLARIYDFEGQDEAALATYRAIPDDHELGQQARLHEVWVLHTLGREDEALEQLHAIINASPSAVEAVSALADMLRRNNDFTEAVNQYTRALSLIDSPEAHHWVLYYARAIAHDQAGAWDAAEADLKAALELSPEQPDVLNYLGYSWVEREVNLAEAESMIARAVEQRPNDGYIVDSMGWVKFMLGDYEEAVSLLEKAVLLRPEDPTINDHLGDAYWAVGRQTEARFQWSHALALGADEDKVSEIRAKIANGLRLERGRSARDGH